MKARTWLTSGLALLGLVLSTPGAQSAPSSFPGRNGRLAIVQNWHIRAYDVDRPGAPPRVTGSFTTSEGRPSYSPDGERIAYERLDRVGGVWVARQDGTGARRIRFGRPAVDPSWSPDGSQIAFFWREELFVARADGRGVRRILDAPELDGFEWSPTGDRFVLELSPADQSAIYTVRADGGDLQRIYAPPSGSQSWSPTWSPDGQRIAFWEVDGCRADVCGGQSWIVTVKRDGSDKMRVVQGIFPAWSPDGRFLAYVDRERLEMMSFATGVKRTVAKVYDLMEAPVWQPRCTRRGGRGRDRLLGGVGPDLICGLGGDDLVVGGLGSDRLFGETGNDRFISRDGVFDIVGCGAGRDTVLADRRDRVGRDCERVTRR